MTNDGRGVIELLLIIMGAGFAFVLVFLSATCSERMQQRSDYRDCVAQSAAHPQAVSACAEILK